MSEYYLWELHPLVKLVVMIWLFR